MVAAISWQAWASSKRRRWALAWSTETWRKLFTSSAALCRLRWIRLVASREAAM